MVPPSTEVCIQVKNLSFRPKATIFPHPPSLYLYGIEHHEFFPLLIGSGGGHLVHRSCLSVWRPHRLWPGRLLCPWDFPGKNTEVGCHVLLQGIFPTQGSNPHLLHCRHILYRWATREAPVFSGVCPSFSFSSSTGLTKLPWSFL